MENKRWWELDEDETTDQERGQAEAVGGPKRPSYLSHDPSKRLCIDGGLCPCLTARGICCMPVAVCIGPPPTAPPPAPPSLQLALCIR